MGVDLATKAGEGETALGDLSRVSFYAGLRHERLEFGAGPEEAAAQATRAGATWIVVERTHLAWWAPRLHEALEAGRAPPGFEPAGRWDVDLRRPKTILAFRRKNP